MLRLPPNYRKAEGYPENPDAPQCYNCLFLRTHEGKYTCNRYLAYILASYVCDDWQKRPRTSWTEKLAPSREDHKMMERHEIRDLQKPFSSKD